jgi:hypothetical protein
MSRWDRKPKPKLAAAALSGDRFDKFIAAMGGPVPLA